jgi:chorismate dehydratase
MSKLRISIVEFLNTAPLVWGFTDGPLEGRYDLSFTVPSLCAEALRAGEADVAIIPAIEYQRMDGMVILPEMSVSAKGEVRSILALSRGPIENVRRMALDTNSRSSVALVRLLCSGLWHISPEFIDAPPDPEAMLKEADAALLIGDPALRVRLRLDLFERKAVKRTGTSGGDECDCCLDDAEQPVPGVDMLFVYDVAQEWRRMTGKPCVLAVWAGRREAITPEVVADFLASKQYGLAHIGDIAEGAALKLDLPPHHLESYLRDNIDYSLDPENLAGLELFFSRSAQAGLLPSARPLEFASLPDNVGRVPGAASGVWHEKGAR